MPDLFDLLAAARGCVSDNFAWELHRLAVAYPAQAAAATDLPTARIRADEMYDGMRRIRLQRRMRRPKRPDWRSVLKARRRGERWPGEWLEGFDGDAICSYPPEDIMVEDFGRYLRRRGKSVLSEEQARTRAVHHVGARRHRRAGDDPPLDARGRSSCASWAAPRATSARSS